MGWPYVAVPLNPTLGNAEAHSLWGWRGFLLLILCAYFCDDWHPLWKHPGAHRL